MTPEYIIEQTCAEGLRLTLTSNGTIRAAGARDVINRWVSVLRLHKPDLIAYLTDHKKSKVYHYRITDDPGTWLVLIAPNTNLAQAEKILRDKFGHDRFIECKQTRLV